MAFSLSRFLKGLNIREENTLTPKEIDIIPGGTGGTKTTVTTSQTSNITVTLPNLSTTLIGASSTDTLTNKTIDADLNTITNIDNNEIKAGAAIDASKLGTGVVDNTEFSYLDGVTSAIQTQINSKQATGSYVTALTGDVTASGPGSVAATIVSVGGSTAADVNTATALVNTAQSGNKFLASPSGGGSGAPAFRAIVSADIPTLNQNTTGTASNITASSNSTLTTLSVLSLPGSQVTGNISGNAANVTGTVAIANGGTGQTSASTAFNALSPMTTGGDVIYGGASGAGTRLANGTNGQVLTSSGGTAAPTWTTVSTSSTDQSYEISNLSIAASTLSNALTIAIKDKAGSNPSAGSPVKVGMRSTTLATGTYTQRSLTSALSMTVSSGSTLGQASGASHVLWVYLIDNAGTLEVAVSQTLFQENRLITTTAEGGAGAADSNAIMYSTTARTNVAFRLVGKLVNTQATAGTWTTDPGTQQVGIYGSLAADYFIGMRYTNSAGTSITNSGADTNVPFATKDYDTHNAYNTSSGIYTVPSDGEYDVSATITYTSSAWVAGNQLYLSVFKNGSVVGYSGANNIQAAYTGVTGPYPVLVTTKCVAGDTLEIKAANNRTAGATSLLTQAAYNYVSIKMVGN